MRRLPAVLALMALAALACGKSKNPAVGTGGSGGTATGACKTTDDCSGGQVCKSGTCAGCAVDLDCGNVCKQCNPGTLACQFRDGCGDDCKVHADCPLGNFCVQGLCLAAEQVTFCGQLHQCPTGKRCNRPLNVCEQDFGCHADVDCDTTEGCNLGTGKCQPKCTDDPTVCSSEEHCDASGLCVQCEKDADCQNGLTCQVDAGLCVAQGMCFRDATCPAGEICYLSTHTCIAMPPPCSTDNDCAYDETCDIPNGNCVPRACTDLYEPNNTSETATAVDTAQGAKELSGLVLCPGDEDWYAIQLDADDQVSVNIVYDVLSSSDMVGELQDAQGRILRSNPFTLTTTVPAGGTFYIHVYATVATQRTNYSLTILRARGNACLDDRFDVASPNNDVRHATPLPSGTYHGLEYCSDNPDFYQVAVPVGKGVTAQMNYDPTAGGGLDLLLYDSDGKLLLGSDRSTSPTENVTASHVSTGVAYIEVTASTTGTQNAYDLTVTVQ